MRAAVVGVVAAGILLLGAAPAAPPEPPVSFISVDELKQLLDGGAKADVIDVRTWDRYVEQHIKGARSMPIRSVAERARELSRTGLVVFYRTCPNALARGASDIVYGLGWRNQRVLEEGLPGWVAKGYPVEGTRPHATPAH